MTSFSIFNWRILIFKSDINYHAKYLACYLSTYMNEHGDNCFPSIDRISHESGVSRPTVIKYIQELKDSGWLEAKKKGFDGQAWAHNQYYPNIPKNVVKEINYLLEGGKPHNERQLTSAKKAVKEVNSSSSVNSSDNSKERAKSKKRFSPPTLKDVKNYIKEKNYDVDSDIFFSHYDETNWFRGKSKMKSWQKTLHTWHLKNKKGDNGKGGYNGSAKYPKTGDCNAWVAFAGGFGIKPKVGEQQYEFETRVKRESQRAN